MSSVPYNPTAPPIILRTGGIALTTKCRSVPPPPEAADVTQVTGDGDSTPGGGDEDTTTGGAKDIYGNSKIFPDAPAMPCPPFYIDMQNILNNATRFNISFGFGSFISYTLDNVSSAYNFYNTAGAVINYQGGNASSRCVKMDIYPAGGIWSNFSIWSWLNHIGFLFSNNSVQSHELTVYVRPHTRLNTHETFSFRLQGRDDDHLRSCIEVVYPTASNSDVLVNANFESNVFVPFDRVKQYTATSSTYVLTPEQWTAVKVIYIVADDLKSVWIGVYEDIDPIDTQGRPKNHWKLRADCIFTGVSGGGYNNIIPTWRAHKNQIRVDGFASVDFMYLSDREIDKGALKNPAILQTAPGTEWSYGSIPSFNPALYDGDSHTL